MLVGDRIVHLTKTVQKGTAAASVTDTAHFHYDGQGKPAMVVWNGTRFGYLYNAQGDVLGLITGGHSEVVKYTYDAWGKLLKISGARKGDLALINPFRYRGYIYDAETEMYYLQTRYYKPEWGRFISADSIVKGNLYAYCNSNPVLNYDPDGKEFYPAILQQQGKRKNFSAKNRQTMKEAQAIYQKLSGGKSMTLVPKEPLKYKEATFTKRTFITNGIEKAVWDIIDFLSIESGAVGSMVAYGISAVTGTPFNSAIESFVDQSLQLISGAQSLNAWEAPETHECTSYELILPYSEYSSVSVYSVYTFQGCSDPNCTSFDGYHCSLWIFNGSTFRSFSIY